MAERSQGADKRRFPRLRDSCGLKFRKIRSETLPEEGIDALTVNISGGGVCFQTAEAVAPGALLAVELSLPDFESAVVSIKNELTK